MPLVPSFQLRLKDCDPRRPFHRGAVRRQASDADGGDRGRKGSCTTRTPPRRTARAFGAQHQQEDHRRSSGVLDPVDRDVLLSARRRISAYDVERTRTYSTRTSRRAGAMTCGRMSPLDAPTAIVGGNGSVQGFDAEGEEVFWTVAGDSVRAALAPPDAEGRRRLIVGSDDASIRILAGNQVETEVTEVDAVTHLASLAGESFAHGLSNALAGAPSAASRAAGQSNIGSPCWGRSISTGTGSEIVTAVGGRSRFVIRRVGRSCTRTRSRRGVGGVALSISGTAAAARCCGLDREVRGYRSREAGWTATTSAGVQARRERGGRARRGLAWRRRR